MQTYTCACMCVCIRVRVYICLWVCVYKRVCGHAYVCAKHPWAARRARHPWPEGLWVTRTSPPAAEPRGRVPPGGGRCRHTAGPPEGAWSEGVGRQGCGAAFSSPRLSQVGSGPAFQTAAHSVGWRGWERHPGPSCGPLPPSRACTSVPPLWLSRCPQRGLGLSRFQGWLSSANS